MSAILTRLDGLAAPIVDQVTKYAGISEQHAKLGVGVFGAGVGVAALWKLFGSSGYNLPPGPRPLPLIGNLHNLGNNPKPYLAFCDLGEKYGDLVTFYFGTYRTILLNTAEMIRQAYIKDDLAYADRQEFASLEIMTEGGMDIIGAPYCPRLQQQRKVAHAALRKYASGEALEKHVEHAFDAMCQEMEKNGKFAPYSMGYLVAYNILASMCFGRKFDFDDPFMNEMMEIQRELEKSFTSPSAIITVLPIMKHFPSEVMKSIRRFSTAINTYLNDCLTTHLESYNPDDLSDYTYHMIHAWKESEKDENEKSKMKQLNEKHFRYILFDTFFAGTDTSRATLAWIWFYLAAFPDVQQKAQKEIDDVIGDAKVTVNCREQLPYVDAVLHEVMRIKPVVPTGVARKATKDTKLGGYDIPKGTMVMNNTWAVHHNEKVWPNPDAFLPERWLDENGKYVFQQNGFLPFSVGRRSCIGESFAKLEFHMLITMLLQRYTLKPAPGKRINLEAIDGFVVRAPDQDVHVERRQK